MKLGYACINESLKNKFRTCRLKTFRENGQEIIKELTLYNLSITLDNIKWNIENEIMMYRLTSELVPFATLPEMNWKWWEDKDVLQITNEIGKLQEKYDLRLTMHPGQYSVINSPKKDVVERAILDLKYHQKLLSLINGTDMIIHTGGEYGNKEESKKRFIQVYKTLDHEIKKMLRLENDDKIFTVEDVLEISKNCGIPICFDIHHHNCNPAKNDIKELIGEVIKTWESTDLIPKMHISSGKTGKKDRSHHDYISLEDFQSLMDLIKKYETDVMFESKKKDLSVLKIKQMINM